MAAIATISEKRCEKSQPHAGRHALPYLGVLLFFFFSRKESSTFYLPTYVLDVLWGQPIKLIHVASNSELHENQWNDLLFFEIVPSHCFGASEA